jgi:hypothetical protein
VTPYPLSSEKLAFAVVNEGGDADAGVRSFCRHSGTSFGYKTKEMLVNEFAILFSEEKARVWLQFCVD